jgi:hypothetical protein
MRNIACLLIVSLVIASPISSHAAGPSAPDTISTLVAKGDGTNFGDGEAYIYASSGSWSLGNPDGCPTAYPYTYSMTTLAGKALHATVLGAYFTKRQVTLYIAGCLTNKPRVIRVDVRP